MTSEERDNLNSRFISEWAKAHRLDDVAPTYADAIAWQRAIDDAEFESTAEQYEKGFAEGYEKGKEESISRAFDWLYEHFDYVEKDLMTYYEDTLRETMDASI